MPFSAFHRDLLYYSIASFFLQDLEGKMIVDELTPTLHGVGATSKAMQPECLSLAWSGDGQTLFAGYTDKTIRVWQVSMAR